MIEVRAQLLILANDDQTADRILLELLAPQQGATVQVVEASRELVR